MDPSNEASKPDDSALWAAKAREAARHMRVLDQWSLDEKKLTREWSGIARELEELAWSVEQLPTLGLYGESQSGKSYLVAGMAAGGYGKAGEEGMKFVASGCKDPKRLDRDFVSDLDPGEGKESTGIICRFIRREDRLAVEAADRISSSGVLIARMSTLAELMASVGVGYRLELLNLHLKTAGGEAVSVERLESLDPIRAADAWEDDPEDLMLQVELALAALDREYESMRSSISHPPPPIGRQVPTNGKSWNELLRWGIERRRRPRLRAREVDKRLGGAPFSRFIEAMWWWEPQSTEIWRKLFEEHQALGGLDPDFSVVAIPVDEAIKGPDRPPVTSVAWFDPLLDADRDRRLNLGLKTKDGWKPVVSSRAKFVGLAKELRVSVSGSSGSEPLPDVLDFPGLRPASLDKRYESVTAEAATWAFRRGKLRLLFRAASSRYDPTMLGICVGVGMNIHARTEMQDDIEIWLNRPDNAMSEHPPLLVVITKADELNKPHNGWKVRAAIEEFKASYSPEPGGWMDRFGTAGRPFNDVHWVYNPFKGTLPEEARDLFLAAAGGVTNLHVKDMVFQAKQLFDPSSCGMVGLKQRIIEVSAATRRNRMIRDRILDRIEAGRRPIVDVVRSLGQDASMRRAAEDASLLIHLLGREESIEDFPEVLLALQISAEDVNHAFNHAVGDSAAVPEQGRRRERKFDRFFTDLRARAARRLADRQARHPFWQSYPQAGTIDSRAIIDRYFGSMTEPDPLLRMRIEAIWEEFERDGAVRADRTALAAMVSTAWNRSIVEPEPNPKLAEGENKVDSAKLRELARRAVSKRDRTTPIPEIRLRPANAASRKILDSWSGGGLADSFGRRFDPQFLAGKNDPRVNNADRDLGEIKHELAHRLAMEGDLRTP